MAKTIINDLVKIFKSSVSAVLPENLIRKSLNYNTTSQILTIEGATYNLQNKHVYLVGAGKAVQNMAREVEAILGTKIKNGIISIPEGSVDLTKVNKNVFYYEGAKNNLPDLNSVRTTQKILDLVEPLNKNDLLLVLISGGGSALLCKPKEPITLSEKADIIKKLANNGAIIQELNTVRKRLSDVKGGQLALKAQQTEVVSLILSDVVGDPLDIIASAPTYCEDDDPSNALAIIEKYGFLDNLSDSIKVVLENTKNFKPNSYVKVNNYVIGSNRLSIQAAEEEANKLNYFPIVLSNIVTGHVKDLAVEYCKLALTFTKFAKGDINLQTLKSEVMNLNIPGIKEISQSTDDFKNKDLCLILGGETTVKVEGNGKGGRNQQLALEFSYEIHKMKKELDGFHVYLLSAGTDGIDGPTDAAGAIGYGDLISDIMDENLTADKFLNNNDSYNFYKQFKNGDLHVITGHTYTNVMDIHLLVIKNKSTNIDLK